MYSISVFRQIEIYRDEPLVSDPSALEVEVVIEMFKKYKSPGSDQTPEKLIQAGDEILC
jgi:hypothetical protein